MKKVVLCSLAIFSLIGCTVYKNISVESQPPGINVNKGGAYAGTTPFKLKVGAGDIFFCSPWYWSFELEGVPPKGNFTPILKNINPCTLPSQSKVFFNFDSGDTRNNDDVERNVYKETASDNDEIIHKLENMKKAFEKGFPSSIRKCNTWRSGCLAGTLGGYGKRIQASQPC